MVNMKLNPGRERGTRAARATSKAVALKHMPAKAERWVSACCTTGGFCARLNSGGLGACAVSEINERFK